MPNDDLLKQTLEHYRGEERKMLEQLQSVRFMIRTLERDLGEASTTQETDQELAADSIPTITERAESPNGKTFSIRPDEYFGMTQAEAARKYLKRIGHAVSFDELVAALQAGGCKVGGANPKKILYISLVRNTRDFVPPRTGFIGLREFYPNAGRVLTQKEAPKKSEKPKKSRKKHPKPSSKAKAKRAAQKASANRVTAAKKPTELAEAVRSVLADRQAHTLDDITAHVSEKIGRPVKKIGVIGTLTTKDVEKIDGKYKLVK